MGQYLSEPLTLKDTSSAENDTLEVGVSSMQGWRVTMEDSHTTILSLPDDEKSSFFGVFDGHGGASVAEYAGKHLHEKIISQKSYRQGEIEDSFRMGNIGDSRAIAYVDGKVLALSEDHKPDMPDEHNRITSAGGFVEYGRVNGNLALSRAFGDFTFKTNKLKSAKEQIVTAFPDVTVHPLTNKWEFILLACDGIWDVLTNEEAAQFIKQRLDGNMKPSEICEEMLMRCLAPDSQTGGFGNDNMTAVIVKFKSFVKNDDEENEEENQDSNI